MISLRLGAALLAMLVALLGGVSQASALDRLRVVSGSKGSWDASVAMLGQRKGIFRDAGLDLEIFYDDGSPVTIQAVASGGADVGVGVNVIGLIGAAMKGVPVKMISSNFDGAPDIIYYVRADNPLQHFRDITDQTIGYSTKGASNHIVAMTLLGEANLKGRLVAVGTEAATMTQVMSGQLDVGHDGTGGLGETEFLNNQVRVIGVGSDAEALRGVTVRGLITSDAVLGSRREALTRFIQAYRKTIAWMYAGPEAKRWLAEEDKTTPEQVESVVASYYSQTSMRLGPIQRAEKSIELGLAFHRLDSAPNPAQLSEMFAIIDPPPSQ